MHRQPAKVLRLADVRLLLRHVSRHQHYQRSQTIILLSFKAGLRACEIAGLTWQMVLGPDGRVASQISISNSIAKKGSGRQIPSHTSLRGALTRLHKLGGLPRAGPVIQSQRGGHMSAAGIVNWFSKLYRTTKLFGCSSHSGRRTFITQSARVLAKTGGSLRDIQELAGHRALTTTERYIMGDRAAQRRLIALI